MTIRDFLTIALQREREMEKEAHRNNNYAAALKKQGGIEVLEVIFMKFNGSHLINEEI